MSQNRLPIWRRITSLMVIASAVLVVVAWNGGSEPVAASARRGSWEGGGSCPLTEAQQLNSIKAFQKMMPVFRHPRCLNCHGIVQDPRASGTPASHMGVVDLSSADPASTCEECHMDKWRLAPDWTHKNDPQLCSDMKMRFTGAQFIDHIVRDGGGPPFIEAGFKGMRGLTEGGLSIVEDTLGTITPAPPPGTHAQFVQFAKEWVRAQGGTFVGDDDCGCVLDKIVVKLSFDIDVKQNGKVKGTYHLVGGGTTTLSLAPDVSEPDYLATTGPVEATGSITFSSVQMNKGNGCITTVQSSDSMNDAAFWLGIATQPSVKLALQIVPGTEVHSVVTKCKNPATGAWVVAIRKEKVEGLFVAAWSALHGSGAAMPAVLPTAGPPTTAQVAQLQQMQQASPLNPANMNMAALQAMAEQLRNAPPSEATGASLGAMMRTVVPNADEQVEAARNNFMLVVPGPGCALDPTSLAVCVIARTVTVPDNLGATQTITERTEIRFSRP